MTGFATFVVAARLNTRVEVGLILNIDVGSRIVDVALDTETEIVAVQKRD